MTKYIKKIYFVLLVVCVCVLLPGCDKGKKGSTTNGREVGGVNANTTAIETSDDGDDRFNASDIAIVTDIDTKKQAITFKSIDEGENYVLTYTSGTRIKSKNDVELTITKLKLGEIVETFYIKGSQKLIEVKEYGKAFRNEKATKAVIDFSHNKFSVGGNSYKYDDKIVVKSDGKDISVAEINAVDEISVRGIGSTIYSIVVTKGHGYVRITDQTNMVGGLLEVGDSILTVISKDMVLVAPEGTHNLTATKDGVGGSKKITVHRDELTNVSISEFQAEVKRYGTIRFVIEPDDAYAIMKIDGQTIDDYKDVIQLPYGKHLLEVTSNNYDTVKKYITVASTYSTIKINMSDEEETTTEEEKVTGDDVPTIDEETTTGGEEETTTSNGSDNSSISSADYMFKAGTNYNKAYVTTPQNVKVYLDGIYQGESPIGFAKPAGSHYILLMKEGYHSKVYSVYFDDGDDDILLRYPDLLKIGE